MVGLDVSILGVHVPGTLEGGAGHEDNECEGREPLHAGEGGRHGMFVAVGVWLEVWLLCVVCVCVCVCVE